MRDKTVSSAYIGSYTTSQTDRRSFLYKLSKNGPRKEPCDKPILQVLRDDVSSFVRHAQSGQVCKLEPSRTERSSSHRHFIFVEWFAQNTNCLEWSRLSGLFPRNISWTSISITVEIYWWACRFFIPVYCLIYIWESHWQSLTYQGKVLSSNYLFIKSDQENQYRLSSRVESVLVFLGWLCM